MAQIKTTSIRQIGILVRDLEKSVEEYEKFLGVKADFVGVTATADITGQLLHGKPCTGRCHQAIFNLENIQLELVSPYGEGDSVWKECLDQDGEGLHHLAFKTNDISEAIEDVENSTGGELMQYGKWPDTPKDGQYAYVDTRKSIGTIIELLEADEGENWA